MLVGICDDDRLWIKKAKKLIQNYAVKVNDEIATLEFESFFELTNYEGKPLDVIFMDIVFEKEKNQNGICMANMVNQKWPNCQVVFLTNYLFYATEVYETKHTYFVVKEQFETRIHDVFKKLHHNIEQFDKKYIFKEIGGQEVALAAKEIRYFERNKRKTNIATVWGNYATWEKISDINVRVSSSDFVRCHNSYIIYLPAIRELRKEDIIMEDGTKIMISRNYRKDVKLAFARWALTQMI